MRNISHIQLKDLEEIDVDDVDQEFEIDGDDYRVKKKKEYYERSKIMSTLSLVKEKIVSFFRTITSTNTRKAILLALLGIFIISFTIIISLATKHLNPVNNSIYSDIKLPGWIKPIHYLAHVETDLTNFTFNGSIVVTLNITKEENFIVIHSDSLDLQSVYLETLSNSYDFNEYPTTTDPTPTSTLLIPDKTVYDQNNTYYILTFEPLKGLIQKGNQYFNLYIKYNATLTDSLRGLYRSSYKEPETGQTKWIALTQFEPTDARSAFPCFDEPALKARWTIWMTISNEYKSLSNMLERSIDSTSSSSTSTTQLVKYETSPIMSTYLICMVIHQFDHQKDEILLEDGKTITIRIWYPPHLVNGASYPLSVAKNVTIFYNKYFDINYPLSKMDLIGVPDFSAGAMENWGLITFRNTDLSFDPSTGSIESKERVAEVVAHEIAHQWFGNLVTMKWWNDLWLNEGFATFMSYKAIQNSVPDFDTSFYFLFSEKQVGENLDSRSSTHSISNNYTSVMDIEASFDGITYSKGASVISMLESILQIQDTDYFQIGIRNYLKKYSYSNAATNDLWDCLSAAAGDKQVVPADVFMKSWVSTPGFPVINVEYRDNVFHLSQKRYIIGSTDDAGSIWPISLEAQDFCGTNTQLFDKKSLEIKESTSSDCLGLFLLNPQAKGFYRVFYDQSSLSNIINSLNQKDIISQHAKIQLVDDYFSFTKASIVEPSKVFEILHYTSKVQETNPVFWKTVFKGLTYVSDRMIRQPCYQELQTYIQNLIQKGLLGNIDIDKEPSGDNEKLLRKVAIAMGSYFEIESVDNYLHSLWEENKETPQNIDIELRPSLFQSIIRNGGVEEYEWIYEIYQNTLSINEREDALRALGDTSKSYLVHRSLNMLINGQVKQQDFGDLFYTLATNPSAMLESWHFVKNNIKYLQENLLVADFGRYMQIYGSSFDSEELLQDFSNFFNSGPGIIPDQPKTMTLETIRANIQWISKNSNNICNWLKK